MRELATHLFGIFGGGCNGSLVVGALGENPGGGGGAAGGLSSGDEEGFWAKVREALLLWVVC